METFLKILGVFFDPAIWVIAIVISSIVTFVVWHFENAAEQSVQADAGNGWQKFTRWLRGLFTPRR